MREAKYYDQNIQSADEFSHISGDSIIVSLLNQDTILRIDIIHHSDDSIPLQTQDNALICTMEALNKNNQWLPIEYWPLSWCGNSYDGIDLKKGQSLSLMSKAPTGDYKTLLRYKILGFDTLYYSNSFAGNIEYCQFKEDSSTYI
ncbi:hypothetical protein [Fulvivirga ligni]|uniref:hypothetical protein n=1 Tax=Fulvivirga ligni TaxID=2904246 RepID=UPI001F2E972E|nr:hypothetical protein [Fulvivirga ligni]UII23573.1 hypothetical protein LVD16_10075 [Fulvivirga ligni]